MNFDRSLLTFDPPHIHKYDGKRLLGVTTALSAISKGDGLLYWASNCACDYAREQILQETDVDENGTFRWGKSLREEELNTILLGAKFAWREKRDEAAAIGTIAHNWIEAYLKGYDPDWPADMYARRSCEAAVEWIKSVKWKTLFVERQIYIPELEVAGICDWVAEIDGVLSLPDWKTSKSLHSTYAYQTAAYLRALENELGLKIPNRYLVRIDKETGVLDAPRVLTEDTIEADYKAFESAVNIYRREAAIKKEWT